MKMGLQGLQVGFCPCFMMCDIALTQSDFQSYVRQPRYFLLFFIAVPLKLDRGTVCCPGTWEARYLCHRSHAEQADNDLLFADALIPSQGSPAWRSLQI